MNILDFGNVPWALPPDCMPSGPNPFSYATVSGEQTFQGAVDLPSQESSQKPAAFSTATASSTTASSTTASSTTASSTTASSTTASSTMAVASSKGTVSKLLRDPQKLEHEAQRLLAQNDFTGKAMETLLHNLEFLRGQEGREFQASKRSNAGTIVFGLFSHGGVTGITNVTHEMPNLVRYINAWFRSKFPGGGDAKWTSFCLNVNMASGPHKDNHNTKDSMNYTATFGKFQGGSIWLGLREGEDPSDQSKLRWKMRQGRKVPGEVVDVYHKPIKYSPKQVHASMAWTGTRISVTMYSCGQPERMIGDIAHHLQELMFPGVVAIHMLAVGDTKTCDETTEQCEQDLEQVFDLHQGCMTSRPSAARRLKQMLTRAAVWVLNSNSRSPPTSSARHGESDGSGERHGGRGGGRRHHYEEHSGKEAGGGLEADGHGDDSHAGHRAQTDGDRLPGHQGETELAGENDEHAVQEEEPQGPQLPHRTGHRRTTSEVAKPQEVGVGASVVSSWARPPAVPSQLQSDVVDLPTMWEPLETPRRHQGDAEGAREDVGGRGHNDRSPRTSLPAVPPGSSRTPCPRTSPSGDRRAGQGESDNEGPEPNGCRWINSFFHCSYHAESQTGGHWVAARAAGEDTDSIPRGRGRDPRDLHGRRHDRRGHGDRGFLVSQRRGKVLVGGEAVEQERGALPAQRLRQGLQRRGWLMATILTMFTWTSTIGNTELRHFGKPVEHCVWSEGDQDWKFEEPSTSSTPSTRVSGDVHCFLFQKENAYVSWLADASGKVEEVPKDVNKVLHQALLGHGVDVSEVYSPPRLTARAKERGMKVGPAMDLITGWDFSVRAHCREALRLLREHRPTLVGLSPPCGPFSAMRNLSSFKRNSEVVEQEVRRGRKHLRFAVTIALMQLNAGRGFYFEHPAGARSWRTSEMQPLLRHPDVYQVRLDMCAFGLKSPEGELHLKPTVVLTNVEEIANALDRRCSRDHTHRPLLGHGLTRRAAEYTEAFVDAILDGLRRHLQQRHFPVFGLNDSWQWQGDELVCTHFSPRTTTPCPQDCPWDVSQVQFTGRRRVCKQFVAGDTKTTEDCWTSTPGAADARPWTGATRFQVQHAMVLPKPFQEYADWLSRGPAHPLYQYQQEETVFLLEYLSLFPSHRVLEGREQERAGAQDEEDSGGFDLDDFLDNLGGDSDDEEQLAQEDDLRVVSKELRELPVEPKQLDDDVSDIPPELRRELYRIHRNLGHPDLQTFCRALRHAGVKKEVLKWVKNKFHCPICARRKKPNSHRPGHLARHLGFNAVVGIDLVFVHRKVILNCVCWGTHYQMAMILPNKEASNVAKAFMAGWMKYFGPPEMVVMDQGSEFVSKDFADVIGEWGVVMHMTDVRSPWQNSRTERAGATLKAVLHKLCDEQSALSEEEFNLALDAAVWCRNQYFDRSGFSPCQRVFGRSMRVPYALLSDDVLDRDLVNHVHSDDMRRAQKLRNDAMKAWAEVQDETAIYRATKTNTRNADLKEIGNGDVVYLWRHTTDYVGWVGPGVVVCQTENGRSLWVSLRGYLIKASREQVRQATNEEHLGAELVKVMSGELLEQLESGKLRHFRDIRDEGGPPEAHVNDDVEMPELAAQGDVQPGEDETMEASEEVHEGQSTRAPSTRSSRRPSTTSASLSELPRTSTVEVPAPLPIQEDSEMVSRERAAETAANGSSRGGADARNPSSTTTPRRPIQVDEASGGVFPFGPATSNTSSSTRPTPYPFSSPPPAWPKPTSSTFFYEVTRWEDETLGARWWKDKVSGHWEPMAQSRTAFALDEAMAVYSPPDRKFFLAKRSPGQVTFNRLPEKEQEFFYKSRLKEIKTLLESGAISILSPTESRKFRAEHPDYILESKFVDRWKPTEEFTALAEDFDPSEFQEGEENAAAPKSRWCVVGWQDPMITSIERSAPTPLSSSVYLALQLSATRKWPIYIKDAKAAFTQALPTTRKQLLACTQPKDGLFPGCTADQLILLHTEVYGLVSGPSWWRRSLLEVLISDLGYQLNPFDKCVLTLPQEPDLPRPSSSTSSSAIETTSSTTFATKRATTTTTSSATNSKAEGKTRGVVVIQVDDLLESGDEEHRRRMQLLEERFRFGKIVKLMEVEGGTGYSGRRLFQYSDFSVGHTMDDYVLNRIKPVILKRKVLRKNAQEVVLNSEELTQFRAALATLNWVSREGRPDVAAAASVLASRFPHPTARDVFELNDVLHRLKTHRITLKIPVIAETDIRHFVISDSAHDPSGRTKPQHGWLQGITTPSLNRGLKAPVSLMMWRSRKLRRKAGNTLLCESIALSTSLGSLERQAAVWLSLTTSDFRAKQIVQESASELRGQATVIAEDCPGYVDPRAIAVVDAKSLYDGVHSEQPNGEDDRSALEMAVIQESLQALGGRIRWVPHNRNPADGLTKLLGAHMDPLLELLATNSFQLEDELGVLAQGKQGDHRLKSRA